MLSKKEKPSGDGTPRALGSITRLHARSSTARGWYGLTSAAAEAPIVTGKRGTSGFPARHRISILPQPGGFVKHKFKLCAFPLEKLPSPLRLHFQLVSGTALTKQRLLYCSHTKSMFCIIGYAALLFSRFRSVRKLYQTSFSFSRGKGAFEQFSLKPRVKEKGKICKPSATSTAIRLLLANGICSRVLSPRLRVLFPPSWSPPCFPDFITFVKVLAA